MFENMQRQVARAVGIGVHSGMKVLALAFWLPLALMLAAASAQAAFASEAAQIVQLQTSPLASRQTAQAVCPQLASSNEALWTGYWIDAMDGQSSFCELIQAGSGSPPNQQVTLNVLNRSSDIVQIVWLAPNGQQVPIGNLSGGTQEQLTAYVGNVLALMDNGQQAARHVVVGGTGEQLAVQGSGQHQAAASNGNSSAPAVTVANKGSGGNAQAAPAANSNGVNAKIISVQCVSTTFGLGNDHVYLTFSTGGRLPDSAGHNIDTGEVWSPNYPLKSDGPIDVRLMEYSIIGSSSQIGDFTVGADSGTGRFTKTLEGRGGRYIVTYEVRG